jgi:hypothetical protein
MASSLFTLEHAKKLLLKPNRILGVYNYAAAEVNRRYYRRFGSHSGVDIMTKDWDNLFLVDGCRADLFENVNWLSGEYTREQAPGSSSMEFIESTFVGHEFHDTVMITANPHAFRIEEETFHAFRNLLHSDWDSNLGTVHPEAVAKAVNEAHNEFPNKRLIGHFMQPHFPFIGSEGRKLRQSNISHYNENNEIASDADVPSVWNRLRFNLDDLDRCEAWDYYAENLQYVLNVIEKLAKAVDGKTIITSDHGNLVGDVIGPILCRGYGHPPYLHVEKLTTIPWLERGGPRREITTDTPVGRGDANNEKLESQLKALGYQ